MSEEKSEEEAQLYDTKGRKLDERCPLDGDHGLQKAIGKKASRRMFGAGRAIVGTINARRFRRDKEREERREAKRNASKNTKSNKR